MLSTHLSFREIGEEMFLSRHTVKAEAMSIYRKLGVSSRNQAVGRAPELALLDKLQAGRPSLLPRWGDASSGPDAVRSC